jgi:hypothetical protein
MSSAPIQDASLLTRIRGEFTEMPGLSLTFRQACRLWQIDPVTCEALLKRLVAEKFLSYSPSGLYAAYTPASVGLRQSTTAA